VAYFLLGHPVECRYYNNSFPRSPMRRLNECA